MLDVRVQERLSGAFALDATFSTAARHVGLFGRSGSGKTTLLNIIAGIHRPAQAVVHCDSETWLDTKTRARVPLRRRHVGYMTQDPLLFPHRTVEANLRYSAAGATATSEFDRVVGALRLRDLLTRMPRNLSGGEQHRVALGRALLSQPKLLLLDEPFIGLDDVARREAIALLLDVKETFDIPSIVVSHDGADLVALTDEVLVMEHGTISGQGEPLTCLSAHTANPQSLAHRLDNLLRGVCVRETEASELATLQWGDTHLTAPRPLGDDAYATYGCYAHSIMLSREEPNGQSARNHVHGTVTALDVCGTTRVVTVDVGHATVRALVTAATATEMHLQSGAPVWLSLKVTSLAPLS